MSDSIVDDGNTLHRERERLTKINDLLQTLDYQSLASSLVSIEESENELQSYTQRLEVATEKKKLLELFIFYREEKRIIQFLLVIQA